MMKFTAAIFAATVTASSAFAFTAPSSPAAAAAATTTQTSTVLRMSDNQRDKEVVTKPADPVQYFEKSQMPMAADGKLPANSQALPFAPRPTLLDKTLAGDVGFDPLGLASDRDVLMQYREAEIKHARLAMLAAAGWPLSELWDRKLAAAVDMEPVVGASDRAPSVLNGGLNQINNLYWVVCIALASGIELYTINRSKVDDSYMPGDLGFDPLGVYPSDEAGRQRMQLAEIKNGRLAMLAITGFAFQEFVTKKGVIDQTPQFFKPMFMDVATETAATAGYAADVIN